MSEQSSFSFDSIVKGIVNNLCEDLNNKLVPLEFRDNLIIDSFGDFSSQVKYIEKQLKDFNEFIENCDIEITKYSNSFIEQWLRFQNKKDMNEILENICQLYLLDIHFDKVDGYYSYICNLEHDEWPPKEEYSGEIVYKSLYQDTKSPLNDANLTDLFINMIVTTIRKLTLENTLLTLTTINCSDVNTDKIQDAVKDVDQNPLDKFIYNINIHSESGKHVSIFKTNPFDYFNDIIPNFKDAKNYISSQLRKIQESLNKELFLDELLTTISQIETSENSDLPDADDYLKPYNLTFEQLMASTDKSIPIVYEIGLSLEKINFYFQDPFVNQDKFAQKATFVRLVPYHYKTIMIDYITCLKEKVEKDKNLNLQNNSNASPSNTVKESKNINYESYEFFKNGFHYPWKYSPLGYYHLWQENLNHLKSEIEDNLLNLETPLSNIYLSKLNRELVEIQKTSNTTLEELNVWYKKYNTNEDDLFKNYDYKNTLHKILNSEPINDRNAYDDDLHPDTDGLQRTFYDYHYGQILEKALRFIRDLKIDLEILSSNKNIDKNEKIAPKSEFKKQTKNAGFVLLKNKTKSDKFKHFYYGLFDNGFIGDNLATFRQAFNGTSDSNKIVWLKGQNELNYLIYNLIDKEIIHNYGAWLHTHKMFILENGKPLGTHLKTNYYKGEHAILKNIINSFI